MKARVPGEPSADQRGLVRPVVVHDDVHVQVGRHLDIEGGQEGAKLDRAMLSGRYPSPCESQGLNTDC